MVVNVGKLQLPATLGLSLPWVMMGAAGSCSPLNLTSYQMCLVLPLNVFLPHPTGYSHMPQGSARTGTGRGCLLAGEHRGPAHFQQPPTLPHIRPIQGLPPGPGREHGFLGHWGGLSPPLMGADPSPQPINCFLPLSPLVCLVFGVLRPALTQTALLLQASIYTSVQATHNSGASAPRNSMRARLCAGPADTHQLPTSSHGPGEKVTVIPVLQTKTVRLGEE